MLAERDRVGSVAALLHPEREIGVGAEVELLAGRTASLRDRAWQSGLGRLAGVRWDAVTSACALRYAGAMRTVSLALFALVGACSSRASLVVDLKTDVLPGREFTVVRQVITGPSSDSRQSPVVASADYTMGVRIAEYASVGAGQYVMTTQLLDGGGHVVAQRVTEFAVAGDVAVTVIVSRGCIGLACPGPSDAPAATTCEGNRCVPPTCSSVDRTTCTTGCAADSDCPAYASCAPPRCISGGCFYAVAVPCGSGLVCDPDVGCVPATDGGPPDAGPPDSGADAGPPDAGPPDLGTDGPITGCGTPGTTTETGSCCSGGTRQRDVTCNADGTTTTGPWSGCMGDGCGAGTCCGGLRCRAC